MPNKCQAITWANDATHLWVEMRLQASAGWTVLQPFITDGPHVELCVLKCILVSRKLSESFINRKLVYWKLWNLQCLIEYRFQSTSVALLPLWKVKFHMTLILCVFLSVRSLTGFVCLKPPVSLQWNSTQFRQYNFPVYPLSNIDCQFLKM